MTHPAYEPEDYAAARKAMLFDLASADTVHEFQGALAALASIDVDDSGDALEAMHLFAKLGVLAWEFGPCAPLLSAMREGASRADARLTDAKEARERSTEAPGEREAWERSMKPVQL